MKILTLFSNYGIYQKKYIRFIQDNFDINNHRFIIFGYPESEKQTDNILFINKQNITKKYFELKKEFNSCTKIIFNGFFYGTKTIILFHLLIKDWKKVYWVIWGGDLYSLISSDQERKRKINIFIQKKTYKKINNYISFIRGDFDLARNNFNKKAFFLNAYMPNQIDFDFLEKSTVKSEETISILIGNSADPSNNHLEVLEYLKAFKNENIKIIIPLSYGDKGYAKKIIKSTKEIFGSKFIPLTELLPSQEYSNMLANIDIAIFNHNRQQGMGNILALLFLGKKVYLRSDVTSWEFFSDHDIEVFDTQKMEDEFQQLIHFDSAHRNRNKNIIKELFSKEKCKQYWENIFND